MHHEGKRPPAQWHFLRPDSRPHLSAFLRTLLHGLAIRRRPGQRQHIETEAAGLVLPQILRRQVLRRQVLRRQVLSRLVLRERDDGEQEDETDGNRGGARRLLEAMAKHGGPPGSIENKW